MGVVRGQDRDMCIQATPNREKTACMHGTIHFNACEQTVSPNTKVYNWKLLPPFELYCMILTFLFLCSDDLH